MSNRPTSHRHACRRTLASLLRGGSADSGNAMIEFALVSPILLIIMLNAVDFSFLAWAGMEVDNAAEMGAQAAYTTCSPGTLPATGHCATLNSIVTAAAQSTSLGTAVTINSGAPSETYYCTITGNTLYSVGTPPSAMPANCSSAGAGYVANVPGDYVKVNVSYTYNPIFAGLSLVPSQTLSGQAMQRLQ
jgi:Flp pilus assembly protein TadG